MEDFQDLGRGSLFSPDGSDENTNCAVGFDSEICCGQAGGGVIGQEDAVRKFEREAESFPFSGVEGENLCESG